MIGPNFLSPLRFQDDGGLPFTLLEPLIYYSELLDRVITVPQGFKTDLASIPRFFWRIFSPLGPYDAPAVVHDYLYRHNTVTRRQADDVFKESMGVTRTAGRTRNALYLGVRVGGWVPWNRYRRADGAPET